jgi:hypothetical protein
MRRSDRPFKQFPAHQNQCASIDLHPNYTEKNLLATGGGRDKFIRVRRVFYESLGSVYLSGMGLVKKSN